MFRRNFYFSIRSKPFLTALLVLTMGVIFSVVFTAYGTICSLAQFYANPQNVRYCVMPRQAVRSGDIDCNFNIEGVREQIFAVSTANSKSSTALVGVFGQDQWSLVDDIDLFAGNPDELNDLAAKTRVAWASADYYNPYEHIDLWIEEITIDNTCYAVAGIADFYFSQRTWNQFVIASEAFPLQADIGIPPSVDSFGNIYTFPDMAGTVLISGADLSAMDVPISFVSVVFETPPTKAQYAEMRSHFDSSLFDVDEYRSGSSSFNFSHINGTICGIAVLLTLLLACGLVRFFLDAQQEVWRGLYLIGCTRLRLLLHMEGILAILYLCAALIATLPCFHFLASLAESRISVEVSWKMMVILSASTVLLALLFTLPACISAMRRYSREEGAYVQTL